MLAGLVAILEQHNNGGVYAAIITWVVQFFTQKVIIKLSCRQY